MKTIAILAFGLTLGALPAQAQQDCVSIPDDHERLACYDTANKVSQITTAPSSPDSKWQVEVKTSAMTDQTDVYMSLTSNEPVPSKFGMGSAPATLFVRCHEDTSAVFVTFNDHFMADIQGYGRVEYRLDKQKMTAVNMDTSTDNKALGLWQGGRAIPFIKTMFDHDTLILRATPFNESAITLTFDIRGLKESSEKLRSACKW